jgi:hypothetical protein
LLLLFANKSKTKTWKKFKQNTDLFINCVDFVVVRTKINKKLKASFFFYYAWALRERENEREKVEEKRKLENKSNCLQSRKHRPLKDRH